MVLVLVTYTLHAGKCHEASRMLLYVAVYVSTVGS
jgi:hypothetical protein